MWKFYICGSDFFGLFLILFTIGYTHSIAHLPGMRKKMLENRPEDALGSLVKTVETDCRD